MTCLSKPFVTCKGRNTDSEIQKRVFALIVPYQGDMDIIVNPVCIVYPTLSDNQTHR